VPGSSPAASGRPQPFRALRHRNYQLFFGGQFVSLTGTWMQSVAQSWLVYRLTGSAGLLGLVGFAGQIPVFLLAPFGGAVADARGRHPILLATQSLSMLLALALAAVTLAGRVQVWHVFAIAALVGMVNAFDIPARQAFIADMVGRRDLMNAIALNSSMFTGARIVGPAMAGVLVATIGEGWCFLLNGLSYVAVIGGLLLMRIEARTPLPQEGSALANIVEGFRYVRRTPPVRALLLMLGLVSLTGMPYAVLMPVFADRILHGGPGTLGLLMGASGFGALAAASLLATREGVRGLGRWIALASAGFGVSLLLFAWSTSVWLSAAALVPVGFCMLLQMASSNTLIQAMVPDALRGRVMAIYSMMFMGMAPFGALLAGTLADRIGAPATVAGGGAACILGALVFGARLPTLRPQARRIILAQQAAAGEPAQGITGTATAGDAR
jgi:MFS family permease